MKRWALVALVVARVAAAQGLPAAKPESAGVSSERLDRMHKAMQAFVDRHDLPGVVVLIARNGKTVDFRAIGGAKTDSLFRLASMSKPITSVAIMILFDEGKLLLTDPVAKYLPEFKDMKVAVLPKDGKGPPKLVPAERPITIRDLLTHRSGITYGFMDGGPVGDAYRKNGVEDGLGDSAVTLADNVARLAKAPLANQPGKEFRYGLSVDVLGRVVEVVSGQPFDTFLSERIFKPLKMNDTGFVVSDTKWARLVQVLTGGQPMKDHFERERLVATPQAFHPGKKYLSGGAGLVGTASDYARFCQMMLNGGELDGARILSRKTVEFMTASHTRDLPHELGDDGGDFGLGFAVTMDVGATQKPGSVGAFGWAGAYGTVFFIDPKEKLVAVLMTQAFPPGRWMNDFQILTYGALK
jgi:CubicO group peptidase (beta-lactamase class C family)